QGRRPDRPPHLRRRLGPQQEGGGAEGRHERPRPGQRRTHPVRSRLKEKEKGKRKTAGTKRLLFFPFSFFLGSMPMPPYPVLCYTAGWGQAAVYKLAARWSDGVTEELKTYGLSCAACLPDWLARSRQKQKACRLAVNETLEPPGVWELVRGARDRQLVHR